MLEILRGPALIAGIIASFYPSAVSAKEYYYFYKPQVDRSAYIADRQECDKLAGGVRSSPAPTYYIQPNSNLTVGQNALAAGLAGLFIGLMSGGEKRRMVSAVERTCMADKGYARYAVEKAMVKEIETLERIEERVERYFQLATAAAPLGTRITE